MIGVIFATMFGAAVGVTVVALFDFTRVGFTLLSPQQRCESTREVAASVLDVSHELRFNPFPLGLLGTLLV